MALPILDGNQSATTLSTILTGGAHIPAHTVVSLGTQAITDVRSAVSGSVVSISNFPSTQTIAGTVTANTNFEAEIGGPSQPNNGVQISFYDSSQFEFKAVADSTPLPISGTVTANGVAFNEGEPLPDKAVWAAYSDGSTLQGVGSATPLPISGTVTANVPLSSDTNGNISGLPIGGFSASSTEYRTLELTEDNKIIVGSLPAISGTVTANNPSGALTTRLGSVATANLAFITSAVTNTSRKYLLAQNISAGTVTIGIGFSPTTTQGIQLSAGGGLTFDAFCPTGAVYWLGAVTGAAFTILEG